MIVHIQHPKSPTSYEKGTNLNSPAPVVLAPTVELFELVIGSCGPRGHRADFDSDNVVSGYHAFCKTDCYWNYWISFTSTRASITHRRELVNSTAKFQTHPPLWLSESSTWKRVRIKNQMRPWGSFPRSVQPCETASHGALICSVSCVLGLVAIAVQTLQAAAHYIQYSDSYNFLCLYIYIICNTFHICMISIWYSWYLLYDVYIIYIILSNVIIIDVLFQSRRSLSISQTTLCWFLFLSKESESERTAFSWFLEESGGCIDIDITKTCKKSCCRCSPRTATIKKCEEIQADWDPLHVSEWRPSMVEFSTALRGPRMQSSDHCDEEMPSVG